MRLLLSALIAITLPTAALAWRASGVHEGMFSVLEGGKPAPVEATQMRVLHDVRADTWHVLLNFERDDRDCVLNVWQRGPEGTESLPSSSVRFDYVEYDGNGQIVFEEGAAEGQLTLRSTEDFAILQIVALISDGVDPTQQRRLRITSRSTLHAPPATNGGGSTGGGTYRSETHTTVYADSGGCDGGDDWEDDSSSSGGCEGDSSGGGGCEGDDLGGDAGGGCEGDDLGGGGGCSSDAMAGGKRRRRSPVVARIIGWMPWLMVFGFIRVARGRRRRVPARRR